MKRKIEALSLFLFIAILFLNTSCARKIGEDAVPFLSFELLTNKEVESKSIYLNFWDIENGKAHLSKTPFYECYSRTFAFPVFWSGGSTLYFNREIKPINKDIKLEIPLVAEFDTVESKIRIFSEFELEKKVVAEYILPPNVFPEDIFPNSSMNVGIVVSQSNVLYVICTYPSLNPKDKQDMLTKLFIVSIENSNVKSIPVQSTQIYSLNTPSFPLEKGYALVNGKLLLPGRIIKSGFDKVEGSVISLSLADGKLETFIPHSSFLGVFKQFVVTYGYLWKNDEYGTEIIGVDCTAYKDKNLVSELKILKGPPPKIEIFRGGVLTDEIWIKKFNMNIFFPNLSFGE